MPAQARALAGLVLVVLLAAAAAAGWFALARYGAEKYDAGYTAAVAAGKKQRDVDAAINRQTEADLRAQLREQDAAALRKEREHAEDLAAAQRRHRAGTDRLRCPAGPVPAAAAPGHRPAAGESDSDGEGPTIVPEVAAEILGDGADIARIVRQYDQVVERFEACRALNAR